MAVYVALGANLGDRKANLVRALDMMAPQVRVVAVSRLYQSEPQPPAPPPSYLNAAARVETALEPEALLRFLKDIEKRCGRQETARWAPRPIDLDIVLYDGLVLETDALVIPHPRLVERNFVLQPLLDMDAQLVHPATGEGLAEIAARLGDGGLVVAEDAVWYPVNLP